MTKKTFQIIIILLFFFYIKKVSGQKPIQLDKETIEFMDYIRDSMLKIDSWSNSPFLSPVPNAVQFTHSEFQYFWRPPSDSILSAKELNIVFRKIKDTITYVLNPEQQKTGNKYGNLTGYYHHQLSMLKYKIQHYLFDDQNIIHPYCLTKLKIDSSLYPTSNYRMVADNIKSYNNLIDTFRAYIRKEAVASSYRFSKPIFLRKGHLCIFIYSYQGEGHIDIYQKDISGWHLHKNLVKFQAEMGWSE